jgi:hypothetical protein
VHDAGWRNSIVKELATREAQDVKAFQSDVDKLLPLRGGYEVQDEDGYFYLGGVNGGEGLQEGERVNSSQKKNTDKMMFADLSDDEQEGTDSQLGSR